jgi:hypothetical protein
VCFHIFVCQAKLNNLKEGARTDTAVGLKATDIVTSSSEYTEESEEEGSFEPDEEAEVPVLPPPTEQLESDKEEEVVAVLPPPTEEVESEEEEEQVAVLSPASVDVKRRRVTGKQNVGW